MHPTHAEAPKDTPAASGVTPRVAANDPGIEGDAKRDTSS
jgi:hypothetical protein